MVHLGFDTSLPFEVCEPGGSPKVCTGDALIAALGKALVDRPEVYYNGHAMLWIAQSDTDPEKDGVCFEGIADMARGVEHTLELLRVVRTLCRQYPVICETYVPPDSGATERQRHLTSTTHDAFARGLDALQEALRPLRERGIETVFSTPDGPLTINARTHTARLARAICGETASVDGIHKGSALAFAAVSVATAKAADVLASVACDKTLGREALIEAVSALADLERNCRAEHADCPQCQPAVDAAEDMLLAIERGEDIQIIEKQGAWAIPECRSALMSGFDLFETLAASPEMQTEPGGPGIFRKLQESTWTGGFSRIRLDEPARERRTRMFGDAHCGLVDKEFNALLTSMRVYTEQDMHEDLDTAMEGATRAP